MAQIDDGYWATFDARAMAPSSRTAAADPGEPPDASAGGEQDAVAADAGDDAPAETSEEPEEASPDETAAAASAPPIDPAQLNQRVGKWAYRIPEYLFNRLSTARSELVGEQDGTS